MSVPNDFSSESEILDYLQKRFNSDAITTTDFRNFIGISQTTDNRMRKAGQYPRIIQLPGSLKNGRIFLLDLAKWIAQGGCQISPEEYQEKLKSYQNRAVGMNDQLVGKKRGRPARKTKNGDDAEAE